MQYSTERNARIDMLCTAVVHRGEITFIVKMKVSIGLYYMYDINVQYIYCIGRHSSVDVDQMMTGLYRKPENISMIGS